MHDKVSDQEHMKILKEIHITYEKICSESIQGGLLNSHLECQLVLFIPAR